MFFRSIPRWLSLRHIVLYSSSTNNKINQDILNKTLTPELCQIWDVFKSCGEDLRLTSSAVVELLQNKVPECIEFRTSATPDKMRKMFCETDIQLIPLKGERYGSAIIKIDDNSPGYEIFATRIYNKGQLIYTKDWLEDVKHRDFTINSITVDFYGNIYDYADGLQDFENKHIKFVGEGQERIKEDPLRILKYFRLHGQLFESEENYSSSIMKILSLHQESLKNIMGERIWLEMQRILLSHSNYSSVKTLAELGLTECIGLPQSPNITELKEVWSRSFHLNPNVMVLLVALLRNHEELLFADKRLKFTKVYRNPLDEYNLAIFLMESRYLKDKPSDLKTFKHLLTILHGSEQDVKAKVTELLKYLGRTEILNDIVQWKIPVFPINKRILKEKGIKSGSDIAAAVIELKKLWMKTNYQASADELLTLYANEKVNVKIQVTS